MVALEVQQVGGRGYWIYLLYIAGRERVRTPRESLRRALTRAVAWSLPDQLSCPH